MFYPVLQQDSCLGESMVVTFSGSIVFFQIYKAFVLCNFSLEIFQTFSINNYLCMLMQIDSNNKARCLNHLYAPIKFDNC